MPSSGSARDAPFKAVDPAEQALRYARQSARLRGSPARARTRRASPRRRTNGAPVLLRQAVTELARKADWLAGPVLATLWNERFPEIARHVFITRIDEATGIFHLSADSVAWATQLRLLAPTLVTRFNEFLQSSGRRPIRSLRVSGPADHDAPGLPRHHPPHAQQTPELPPAGSAARSERIDRAGDPLLADALARQSSKALHEEPRAPLGRTADANAPLFPLEVSARPRALLRARGERNRPQNPSTPLKVTDHEDGSSANALSHQGGPVHDAPQ